MIVCPLCQQHAKVDPEKHTVLVDYSGGKRLLMISNRPAICPNPDCSWAVLILEGIAFDVAKNGNGNGAEGRAEAPVTRDYRRFGRGTSNAGVGAAHVSDSAPDVNGGG